MAKRVLLFLAVNFIVVTTITIIMQVLGLDYYISQQGYNLWGLAIFCLIWGMGGAFISLGLSKITAKWMMKVKIIDSNSREPAARELIETVHHLAKKAGLRKMPEVGVYDSPEVNAFATGPTRNNSLVAVSTGLLNKMDRRELEGVLGHEVAHIANGDMVTMTLLQGIVNAFVMFLARILAQVIASALRGGRDQDSGLSVFAYYGIVMALQMVFMVFGSMIVAAFSRYREFRADAGGAGLAGRENMIAALDKLKRTFDIADPEESNAVATLKISNKKKGSWVALFSTHPPLDERIRRLQRPSA